MKPRQKEAPRRVIMEERYYLRYEDASTSQLFEDVPSLAMWEFERQGAALAGKGGTIWFVNPTVHKTINGANTCTEPCNITDKDGEKLTTCPTCKVTTDKYLREEWL